jgi:sec-independent protein translocase protein TatC
MTVVEHLAELRRRIIWSVVVLFVGVGLGFWLADPVFDHFMAQLKSLANVQVAQFTFAETFMLQFHLAFILGFAMALPFVLYQLIAFVAPGLKPGERRMVYTLIPGATLMFVAGLAFGYLIVVPQTMRFLLWFADTKGVDSFISPQEYFGFITGLSVPLGILFQLPLVVIVLARVGILKSRFLVRLRKYWFLISFILGAILSPIPTVIDQILMAIPLLALYEVSIWLARWMERIREAREREESE